MPELWKHSDVGSHQVLIINPAYENANSKSPNLLDCGVILLSHPTHLPAACLNAFPWVRFGCVLIILELVIGFYIVFKGSFRVLNGEPRSKPE